MESSVIIATVVMTVFNACQSLFLLVQVYMYVHLKWHAGIRVRKPNLVLWSVYLLCVFFLIVPQSVMWFGLWSPFFHWRVVVVFVAENTIVASFKIIVYRIHILWYELGLRASQADNRWRVKMDPNDHSKGMTNFFLKHEKTIGNPRFMAKYFVILHIFTTVGQAFSVILNGGDFSDLTRFFVMLSFMVPFIHVCVLTCCVMPKYVDAWFLKDEIFYAGLITAVWQVLFTGTLIVLSPVPGTVLYALIIGIGMGTGNTIGVSFQMSWVFYKLNLPVVPWNKDFQLILRTLKNGRAMSVATMTAFSNKAAGFEGLTGGRSAQTPLSGMTSSVQGSRETTHSVSSFSSNNNPKKSGNSIQVSHKLTPSLAGRVFAKMSGSDSKNPQRLNRVRSPSAESASNSGSNSIQLGRVRSTSTTRGTISEDRGKSSKPRIRGRSRTGSLSVSTRRRMNTMGLVLQDYPGLSKFCSHLDGEFSIENALFLMESEQFLDIVENEMNEKGHALYFNGNYGDGGALESEEDSQSAESQRIAKFRSSLGIERILRIPFPRDQIPRSAILYRKEDTLFDKMVNLFYKYVSGSGEFDINISHGCKSGLNAHLCWSNGLFLKTNQVDGSILDKTRDPKKGAQWIEESLKNYSESILGGDSEESPLSSKEIEMHVYHQIYLLFNDCRREIYTLMKDSFSRFSKSTAYKQWHAKNVHE